MAEHDKYFDLGPNPYYSELVKKIYGPREIPYFKSSISHYRIQYLISRICNLISLQDLPPDSNDSTTNERVTAILEVLDKLDEWRQETPPLEGPRRFGNMAFRQWQSKMQEGTKSLLMKKFQKYYDPNKDIKAFDELSSYFMGGFGSKPRLDFGTGHELSFLAFIGGLMMLGVLRDDVTGKDFLLIFLRYFNLVRKLITSYTLEPAGSHGVWGLDDHFHLIYIFGAAQFIDLKTVNHGETVQFATPRPLKALSASPPPPSSVANPRIVEKYKNRNLYYNAIAFILSVKSGPFFEHSPILYDITGVANWEKIYKGMLKMYDAEVLAKFPVVQHFWFGSALFPWRDMENNDLPTTDPRERENMEENEEEESGKEIINDSQRALMFAGTKKEFGNLTGFKKATTSSIPSMNAPWASNNRQTTGPLRTNSPWDPPVRSNINVLSSDESSGGTGAPWAKTNTNSTHNDHSSTRGPGTKAPWAL